MYSSLKGAPYVPTKQKEVDLILMELSPKKGQILIEFGSGDGRFVRTAVKQYGVRGRGVDINPIMILYARILARIQKISCSFEYKNIFVTDFRDADYIYFFLMPETIRKLVYPLENQLKKNATVVSHGFRLNEWEPYLYKTIPHKPFATFFYRFKRKHGLP